MNKQSYMNKVTFKDKNTDILFVSSAIQQPRHQRRLSVLSKKFNISLLYNIRESYKRNLKNFNFDSVFIGEITRKKGLISYVFCRFLINIKLFFYFIFYKRKSILYLTAPDQAIIALCTFRPYFIEYGDIQALSNGLRITKTLDKIISKYAKGVIVTSPAFLTDYFFKFNDEKLKFCVAENKVPDFIADIISSQESESVEISKEDQGRINLGLIGALGRAEIYSMYKEIIIDNNNYILQVFGDGNLGELDSGHERIILHGAFKNPDDLKAIYNSIDIVLINYDCSDANVKLALPNKLYEAILFEKPIICTQGTYLAEVVENKKIGVSSLLNKIGVEQAIKECVSSNYCDVWATIPRDEFISDNEHVCDFINRQLGEKYNA